MGRVFNTPTFVELNRTKIYSCLVGSHNYNLDDANSDKDYKVFVLPTFDDLYNGKQYSETVVGTDVDYSAHDIRKLALLLWKANINFIETLFSEEYYIGNERIKEIIEQRDYLARMNLPYLWNACQGMYYNKFKLLEKGTEGTQHLVDKYGYDTKQAQHCYRVLDFLERYHANDFTDFKQAIWYEEGIERDFLLQIKQGVLTLNTFRRMVQAKHEYVDRLKTAYITQVPNDNLHEWLDGRIKGLVRDVIIS